jgi:hypothetical protein
VGGWLGRGLDLQRDLCTLAKEQRINRVLLQREWKLGLVYSQPRSLSEDLRLGSETLKDACRSIMS